MNVVIGSGPAGVACAEALLARGEPVCLVDAGLTLEPERREVIARMRGQAPGEWRAEDLAAIKEGMDANAGGVLLKRSFGSDYVYRGPAEQGAGAVAGPALKPSFALGGLSNVWGAAMLPYTASDLEGWPITAAELAPHYAASLRLTGLSGQHDGLEEMFPLFAEPSPLPMSRQASKLWANLERSAAGLRRRGLHFGRSRLAVSPGCVQCGLCMYGCPYDLIYSSAQTVRAWSGRAGFEYRPGIVVERLEETGGGVTLRGYHLENRVPWSLDCARVFLAGGVLPTTRLVLLSREAYERPLSILDSQYYLFPLLQMAGTAGVSREALHTLSQIFLELNVPALSPHTIHLQIYSYSDIIGQALRQSLGPLAIAPLARALEGRMLIAQGYLHSSHSSKLRVALQRDGKLSATAEINPQTARRVRRVVRWLLRQSPALRALPLEPLLQITPPGRGFHSGGTLPMSAKPADLQTDSLGRLPGWERVHVVDSSVFPTIPATTITLSLMANAHRIGANA